MSSSRVCVRGDKIAPSDSLCSPTTNFKSNNIYRPTSWFTNLSIFWNTKNTIPNHSSQESSIFALLTFWLYNHCCVQWDFLLYLLLSIELLLSIIIWFIFFAFLFNCANKLLPLWAAVGDPLIPAAAAAVLVTTNFFFFLILSLIFRGYNYNIPYCFWYVCSTSAILFTKSYYLARPRNPFYYYLDRKYDKTWGYKWETNSDFNWASP